MSSILTDPSSSLSTLKLQANSFSIINDNIKLSLASTSDLTPIDIIEPKIHSTKNINSFKENWDDILKGENIELSLANNEGASMIDETDSFRKDILMEHTGLSIVSSSFTFNNAVELYNTQDLKLSERDQFKKSEKQSSYLSDTTNDEDVGSIESQHHSFFIKSPEEAYQKTTKYCSKNYKINNKDTTFNQKLTNWGPTKNTTSVYNTTLVSKYYQQASKNRAKDNDAIRSNESNNTDSSTSSFDDSNDSMSFSNFTSERINSDIKDFIQDLKHIITTSNKIINIISDYTSNNFQSKNQIADNFCNIKDNNKYTADKSSNNNINTTNINDFAITRTLYEKEFTKDLIIVTKNNVLANTQVKSCVVATFPLVLRDGVTRSNILLSVNPSNTVASYPYRADNQSSNSDMALNKAHSFNRTGGYLGLRNKHSDPFIGSVFATHNKDINILIRDCIEYIKENKASNTSDFTLKLLLPRNILNILQSKSVAVHLKTLCKNIGHITIDQLLYNGSGCLLEVTVNNLFNLILVTHIIVQICFMFKHSNKLELKMMVPKKAAGLIIGHNGSNVQRLRASSRCSIHILSISLTCSLQLSDRIISIVSTNPLSSEKAILCLAIRSVAEQK